MATIEERFLVKVDKNISNRGCWTWMASKNKKGYGQFMVWGKPHLAHRVAYILFIGDIVDNLFVLHDCDNPGCVNPNHLHLGTNSDNMQECSRRGRHWCRGYTITHCPKGHEYSKENTSFWKNHRSCLTCHRERQRVYILKKKQRAA